MLPFPGGRFVTAFVGSLGPRGKLSLVLTLPSDAGMRGFPVTAQSAVLGTDGQVLLTSSVTHVIGE